MSFSNFAIEAGVNSAKPAELAGSDPKSAATPASSGPTSVPSTYPGNTPAPAPASDAADSDELDFGFGDTPDADTDDSDDDEGGAPAEVVPLGPPEGATRAEVTEWRLQHGVPAEPDGYQAPTVDGVNWNSEALAPVLEAAHEHNVPAAAVQAALEAYAIQIQEQQAELKRQDKERLAQVRQKLAPGEIAAVNAASNAMSKELRVALKGARLPSGEPLLGNVEFVRILANLNRQGTASTPITMAQDDATREVEIRQVMRRDISEYYARDLDKDLAAILRRRGVE